MVSGLDSGPDAAVEADLCLAPRASMTFAATALHLQSAYTFTRVLFSLPSSQILLFSISLFALLLLSSLHPYTIIYREEHTEFREHGQDQEHLVSTHDSSPPCAQLTVSSSGLLAARKMMRPCIILAVDNKPLAPVAS